MCAKIVSCAHCPQSDAESSYRQTPSADAVGRLWSLSVSPYLWRCRTSAYIFPMLRSFLCIVTVYTRGHGRCVSMLSASDLSDSLFFSFQCTQFARYLLQVSVNLYGLQIKRLTASISATFRLEYATAIDGSM